MHRHLASITGTDHLAGERDGGFAVGADELERVLDRRPAIVFFCSPNNPTGNAECRSRVLDAVARVGEWGGLVVVDEAYGQFCSWTALDLVRPDRNLAVCRTFSKTWAMAGARLGYLVGPDWLVAELEKVVLPYHLDAVTQAAGLLALEHAEAMEARVARLVESRGDLQDQLHQLDLDVWPSEANFILFRPRRRDAAAVWQGLVDRSVLVRDCSSWPRLEGCLRVTIGSPKRTTGSSPHFEPCWNPPRHREGVPMTRAASRSRTTGETGIEINLDIDGVGETEVSTGLPFFDHMLDQLGRHGGFNLSVQASGDIEVDAHHTVEDTAILLGACLGEALGDKVGVRRFASNVVPLDEAAVEVVLDLSGRPFLFYDVEPPGQKILGDPPFDPQLMEEFWRALATSAGLTLHIVMQRGQNTHHIIEASTKAVARALRDAVRIEGFDVPSTKGVL